MLGSETSGNAVPYGMSSLALAHVGDAVYELLVRTRLCMTARTSGQLHRQTVRCVCAQAQAEAAQAILPMLSEQETAVFRHARNAHVSHVPQGASPAQYSQATALEALFGFLYLTGENERIEALFKCCWDTVQAKENRCDQAQ